jgi:hypothetical protein
MRKVLISLAAAGAALAVASPAAAQYYPQPQPYGYGGGYGYNGYGYNNYGYNNYANSNYGGVRALQARVDAIQWQIKSLDRRDRIRDGRADRFREEANGIEHRLHRAARYGLNPYEANDIQARLARLEQRVQYAANRYGRYGNGRYGDWRDRD